jgi:hypothetical protein
MTRITSATGDGVRRAGQPVAAGRSPHALHQPGVSQVDQDRVQERAGDLVRLGDHAGLHRCAARVVRRRGERAHGSQRVVALRGDLHAGILTHWTVC